MDEHPISKQDEKEDIFIVDEGIVEYFLRSENYEVAELFLNYLSSFCIHKRAYMIPSIFEKVKSKLKELTIDKGEEIQTEILAYFENWFEKAELLGEDDGEEIHDTEVLCRLQKLLHPDCEIIIVSNKEYPSDNPNLIKIEELSAYLLGKSEFKDYIDRTYGLGEYDGAY